MVLGHIINGNRWDGADIQAKERVKWNVLPRNIYFCSEHIIMILQDQLDLDNGNDEYTVGLLATPPKPVGSQRAGWTCFRRRTVVTLPAAVWHQRQFLDLSAVGPSASVDHCERRQDAVAAHQQHVNRWQPLLVGQHAHLSRRAPMYLRAQWHRQEMHQVVGSVITTGVALGRF